MKNLADGTYVQTSVGVQDATPLLQGKGYIVAIKPLDHEPLQFGDMFGSWTDTETGKVYLDRVQHVASERVALNLAAQRGELAIWDVAAAAEIRV